MARSSVVAWNQTATTGKGSGQATRAGVGNAIEHQARADPRADGDVEERLDTVGRPPNSPPLGRRHARPRRSSREARSRRGVLRPRRAPPADRRIAQNLPVDANQLGDADAHRRHFQILLRRFLLQRTSQLDHARQHRRAAAFRLASVPVDAPALFLREAAPGRRRTSCRPRRSRSAFGSPVNPSAVMCLAACASARMYAALQPQQPPAYPIPSLLAILPNSVKEFLGI